MTFMSAEQPPVLASQHGGLATGYLILLIVVGLGLVVLLIAALISIGTSSLNGTAKAGWMVVCLILQFFGPLVWFLWGRKASPDPFRTHVPPPSAPPTEDQQR